MATERPSTRDQARNDLIAAMQENSRQLRAAEARGDKQAIALYQDANKRLEAQLRGTGTLGELGSGVSSAAVGLLTGIPDIVISGYNKAANPLQPIPTLRERLLGVAQIPAEPTSQEGAIAYNAPELAVGVAGITQLGTLGFKGLTSFLKDRKVNNLLSKLPEEEANRFKDLMLKGQGSPNAEVAAKIAELRRNPAYTELFNALDNQATKQAMSGMAPRPSRIGDTTAAQNLAKGVEEKLTSLRKARSEAGNTNFTKAFEQGGDRAILTPNKTISTLDDLIAQQDTTTDSGKAAVKWLQETRDSIAPRINVPARGGSTYSSPTTVRDTLTNAPVQGTSVSYTLPGSSAYTIQQAPRALTVQQVQARLKDWGRSAVSEGGAVRDLAIGDEVRINKALFGAMQDDLSASAKAATSTADKKALGYLQQAREQTRVASENYNNLIAQGMPDFLKGKPINSLSIEQLTEAYNGLNPSQRQVFRSWVGENKAESLQAIDRAVFQAFKSKHTGTLPDGTIGVDLRSMAEDWNTMMKSDPKAADAIATALGQNLNEFNGRMKDAMSLTRRIQTGSLATEGEQAKGLIDAGARIAGTTLGYRAHQAVKLLGDVFGVGFKGVISDELAMKTLLTPEGAAFLKTANLTPGSQKTLEALTKLESAIPSKMDVFKATAAAVTPSMAPIQPEQIQWELPPEEGLLVPATDSTQWELPPEDVNVNNPELGLGAGDIAPRQSPFTNVNPQLQPY